MIDSILYKKENLILLCEECKQEGETIYSAIILKVKARKGQIIARISMDYEYFNFLLEYLDVLLLKKGCFVIGEIN